MTASRRQSPPFSPILLAGFLARPLPLFVLQPMLAIALKALRGRHPGLFERLSGMNSPSFLVDPVDLPFAFVLETDPQNVSLVAVSQDQAAQAGTTATIRGPLLALIDLMEGRIDGDALFFKRDLAIEGETEAVVALRNAIDDAEIDLISDVLTLFGPLETPARLAVNGLGAVFARAARDMETLRDAVIAPAVRQTETQAAGLRDLERKMESQGKARKRNPRGGLAPSGGPNAS
ncbi:MAG: SCP2 sterol-binding domain-containing protein [Rhodospirillales bacterium]|nr:SCP2 sterol-binding domain-containing protein [Rhodospirillales bacterium]